MQLNEKIARTYLILSILIFALSGIMLYFVLTSVMNNRLDQQLLYTKEIIAKRIKYDYYNIPLFEEPEELTEIENRVYPRDTIIYKDTLIFHAIEDVEGAEEYEKYRQLTAYETLQGRRYKLITRNSLVRNQDFILIITLSTVIIILLLLTGLWVLNIQQNPIELEPSNVEEFKELNRSIKSLTLKLQSDFNNLKEFSENASHEMQTPLAIMQSKIELLLQSTKLTKVQSEQLQSIYQAGQRLSKLNKTLLLLAKVENQQFSSKEEVSLKTIIEKQLENYEDFIINKNIKVNTDLSDKTISTNTVLAETLISNLFSNAIKHNIQDGTIDITYIRDILIFSNTGNILQQDPQNLFNRFKKASTRKDSLGLGLAIVKKICDVNDWQISYSSEKNMHQISILFKT
jgi:signal transduction histidine kinase